MPIYHISKARSVRVLGTNSLGHQIITLDTTTNIKCCFPFLENFPSSIFVQNGLESRTIANLSSLGLDLQYIYLFRNPVDGITIEINLNKDSRLAQLHQSVGSHALVPLDLVSKIWSSFLIYWQLEGLKKHIHTVYRRI